MRNKDWPTRLNDYIKSNINTPFEWGIFDCCLFVAGAVEAMTGQDFAEKFRGKYSTAIESVKALKHHGNGDLTATVTAMFGQIKPRLQACRGDIALIDTPEGEALGIVWGGSVWAVTETGLGALPYRKILGCWEVPCHQ